MKNKTLWQRLNADINVANVQKWFERDGDTGGGGDKSRQVERLLKDAELEAERRGIPVEDVLRGRGFQLSDDMANATTSEPEPTESDDESDDTVREIELPTAGRPWRADLDALTAESRVMRKLRLVGVADVKQTAGPRATDPRLPFWMLLVKRGIGLDTLLDVVATEPDAMPRGEEEFVEYLLEREFIGYPVVKRARLAAAERGMSTFHALLDADDTRDDLPRWIAAYAGVEYREEPALSFDPGLLETVPSEWVQVFDLIPFERAGKNVKLLCRRPLPPVAARALETTTGHVFGYVVADDGTFEASRTAFLRARKPARPRADTTTDHRDRRSPSEFQELAAASRAGSAVRFLERVFEKAVDVRATDVHIEPMETGYRVRYRIDGICVEAVNITLVMATETLARLKVLADLDVTERRRPQDGHLRITLGQRDIDMRLAFVPTKRGEKAALRLADSGRVALELESLGMSEDELSVIRRIARRPFGMILATGPVGSGKTTTLYSCLNEVDRTRHHVVSIEDPVEVQLDGANQVEVNFALNFGFAQGLRSLLRQDPDVVLVGEIRDEETAEIGVRASMTGRLVFSTLHANQAVGAITTLRNFGIQPFLIANSLQGVIAQRLVRRICPYCSVPVELTAEDRQRLQLEDGQAATVSRGEGCDACFHTGYSGRVGIFEILDVDDAIREMISEEASERMVRAYAREQGMRSLQEAGIAAALDGRTTLEELQRVLGI